MLGALLLETCPARETVSSDQVAVGSERVIELGGPIADPALEGETDEGSYPAFQRTAAEIETTVRSLLHRIRQRPARR
jgi:hypothetical protein